MIFIHPEMFWGLLTLLIPIIIHLFDFRKNKKVYFSDIRFLKKVKHASSKPLKLKQWLILITRLAFICFLVMVFAQPIIPANGNKQVGNGVIAVYIDNSQSMKSLVTAEETALEKAKEITYSILNQFNKNREIILFTNDGFANFATSLNPLEASSKISEVSFTDYGFLWDNLQFFMDSYEKRGAVITDLFILSDFQKTTSALNLKKIDKRKKFWIAPQKIKNYNNCVVDSVYLKNKDFSKNESTSIEVVIANYGSQIKKDLPIKVFLGNRQVSAASITILPHQKNNISFSLGKNKSEKPGYIQLEDYPNSFDNKFYFSIPKKKQIKVLEIIGENPSTYIASVYGNKNIFNLSTNHHQNIDIELLKQVNFIVLNQVISPSEQLINQLKKFTANGGTILVIPNITFNQSVFQKLNPKINSTQKKLKQKLKTPLFNAPFFKKVLQNSSQNLAMFSSTSVWNWGKDKSAILSFEDGSPYLSELSQNIYFLSGPVIDTYSNFQSHALFVPVMYSLASKSTTPTAPLFGRLESDYYEMYLDSIGLKNLIILKKGDLEIIPNKQKIGPKWRFSFPKKNVGTGIYQIKTKKKIKGYLALNLTKNESDLNTLSPKNITKLFSGANVNLLNSYRSNKKNKEPFDANIYLWKIALLLCLLFLLLEVLLIRFL